MNILQFALQKLKQEANKQVKPYYWLHAVWIVWPCQWHSAEYCMFIKYLFGSNAIQSNLLLGPPENCIHLPIMKFAFLCVHVQRKPGKCIQVRNANHCSRLWLNLPEKCGQLFLNLNHFVWVADGLSDMLINHPKQLFNSDTSVVHVSHIHSFVFVVGRVRLFHTTNTTAKWQDCRLCIWRWLMSV